MGERDDELQEDPLAALLGVDLAAVEDHRRHPDQRRSGAVASLALRAAVIRVPNAGSDRARVRACGSAESAMTASAPGQLTACRAARILGTMPPLMTPPAISRSASSAVIVASFSPAASRTPSTSVIRIELAGAEPRGDAGGGVVRVDVADDPLLVAGQRRHHGDLSGDEQRVQEVAPDAHDVGHEPQTRDALGDHEAAVHAGEADRVDATVAQIGDQLGVDHSPQDGRGHVQGGLVRDPQPALEPAGNAEALQPLGYALSAAVDEDDGTLAGDDRDLVEDVRLVGERRPAELEDEHFAHVVYSAFSMT